MNAPDDRQAYRRTNVTILQKRTITITASRQAFNFSAAIGRMQGRAPRLEKRQVDGMRSDLTRRWCCSVGRVGLESCVESCAPVDVHLPVQSTSALHISPQPRHE